MKSTLTPKRAAFVREYLIDLNATQAAIRAGYSPKGAKVTAAKLLTNANLNAELARAQAERAKRTEITTDVVLRRLWDIATADARELVEVHRYPCADCPPKHGSDPHPDCPECHGLGVERVVVHDTRKLTPAAAALYAGVKTTKDGIEIKTQSKEAAWDLIAKHVGIGSPGTKDDPAETARRIREALRVQDAADGFL